MAADVSREPVPAVRQAMPAQKISRQNYQPVILMEFVACILLTAVTPFATNKATQETTSTPGLSPYAGKDMVKLAAITLLYLMLAMLSVGGRGPGRFAAWFGGLILIVDGMYEASNLVKDVAVLTGGGGATSASSAAAAAAAQTGVNPTVGAQIFSAVSGAFASPTPAGTEPVTFTEPSTVATTSPGLTQPANRFTREGL
jgi:hypothetical protein